MTPTLTPERTERLRTYLVVEAASSVATATPARRAPVGRRLAVAGVGAALVAGGVVVAVLADADAPGPRPGPDGTAAAPPSAPAPAWDTIAVHRADGWTTVALADVHADPDAVVADLVAAGFRAEVRALPVTVDAAGNHVVDFDGIDGTGGDASPRIVAGVVEVGTGGLVGLSAVFDEGAQVSSFDDPDAALVFDDDGSVSLRDGAPVTLVVLVQE